MCGSWNILWHCLSLGFELKQIFSSLVATTEFSRFAGILSPVVAGSVGAVVNVIVPFSGFAVKPPIFSSPFTHTFGM